MEFTFIAVISVLFVYDTVRSTKEALDLARVLESMIKAKDRSRRTADPACFIKAETSEKVSDSRMNCCHADQRIKEEAADRAMKAADTAAQRQAK